MDFRTDKESNEEEPYRSKQPVLIDMIQEKEQEKEKDKEKGKDEAIGMFIHCLFVYYWMLI